MAIDPDDLLAALHLITAGEAFELLQSWESTIDWAGLPGSIALADGGQLRSTSGVAQRPSTAGAAG